jgi:GT2 family glycosyltransferase
MSESEDRRVMRDPATLPRVAIIILNWNNAADTLQCLASLEHLTYPNHEIIVVDNGSTDDSVWRIRTVYPDICIVETGANLGYAEGNNVGIRYALQRGCGDVCVLNNDVIVAPDFLAHLVAEAAADPTIGIVGPKMYFFEPADMIFAAGSMISWKTGTLIHRGIGRRESITGSLWSGAPEDVDFIVGCGVLFRRHMLESVGLFDSRYYLNYEDVDICVRAKHKGYRVRYTPRAVLYHKVSASLGQASPRNTYYMVRNGMLFFSTYLEGYRRWKILARIFMRNVGHIAVWTIKPEYRRTASSKRAAAFWGLRDAIRGRFGKMQSDLEVLCRNK